MAELGTIQIKCRGAGTLAHHMMTPSQGALKTLTDSNAKRLKNEILEDGFIEPISVWEDPETATIHILNGHQRHEVIGRMKDEGYSVPELPVNYVEAVSIQDAKKKLLALASQYGSVSSQGLKGIIEELGILPEQVADFYSFPEIDISALLSGVPQSVIIGADFEANTLLSDTASGDAKKLKVETEASAEDDQAAPPSLFDLDTIAKQAFEYFRGAGFPYIDLAPHEMMQEMNKLAALEDESSIHSTAGYRVADTFHKHRFAASAQNMSSPVDSFNNDKKLKKSIKWHLEGGSRLGKDFFGTLSLVNGTQACSNFRPAFAKYLYDKYCPKGGMVFDSSTGYGGRLVGFLASHAAGYFGTDPNVTTYEANKKLAEQLGAHKKIILKNSPIEDLDLSSVKSLCDFAFTSPPYFTKEIYAQDDTQSCQRYPGYEDWLNGFLKPMLQKQYEVLKPSSLNIVNIEDVNLKGKKYELVKPTIEFAREIGFELVNIEKFPLPNRTVQSEDDDNETREAYESVIILKRNSRKSVVRRQKPNV